MKQSNQAYVLRDGRTEVLDLLDAPLWVYDLDRDRNVWANAAGLEMWGVESCEELAARVNNVSEHSRTRLAEIRELVQSGGRVHTQGAFSAQGRPAPLRLTMSRFPLPDGHLGVLVEAERVASDPFEHDTLRGVDALRYTTVAISLHRRDGTTLMRNPAALRAFGPRDLGDLFVDVAEGLSILVRLARGEDYAGEIQLHTLTGPRWYALDARPALDPVTGDPSVLVNAHDVTDQREARQVKEDFVSVVSHELRTPLTSIRGCLSLIGAGVAQAQAAELLAIANNNCERLMDLVDDLLDARRIAAGHFVVNPAACDLTQVVRDAVEHNRGLCERFGVQFDVRMPGASVPVRADRVRIQQVITNFLSNAAKFSPSGGAVRVGVEADEREVSVTVTDAGPGVPEAFHMHVFRPFAQADASAKRAVGGTGLGLSICKAIVESHGGSIGFDSPSGLGATFWFRLPLWAGEPT